MKRYIYVTHRWLGITLCLLMAMWFISGMVMMYIGYPKLTTQERLAHLPKLDSERCCVSFAAVLHSSSEPGNPKSVRLTTVSGQPTFILNYSKTKVIAVDGVTGRHISLISTSAAVISAQSFLGISGEYIDSVKEDPWTQSHVLDAHRPLHRVKMQDPDETILYVSETTGEVIRDTTANERFWNWIGAWLHWLYPFRTGIFTSQAANIVIYTSLAGCLMTINGIAIGLLRWRFTGKYKWGTKTPYRSLVMRWHHIFGLIFGVFVFTWIFSGLMSMNPWKIFDAPVSSLKIDEAEEIDSQHFMLSIQNALSIFNKNEFYPCELEWRLVAGNGYYIGFDNTGHTKILLAKPDSLPIELFPWTKLATTAARLMGSSKIISSNILTEYDAYYYQRATHTMNGNIEKRLPILRLKFDDTYATWLHIDPYTGTIVKSDSYQRIYRWLFAFLHSWDWLPLLNRRPLWDMLMIACCIGGVIVSISGIAIGFKRLRS